MEENALTTEIRQVLEGAEHRLARLYRQEQHAMQSNVLYAGLAIALSLLILTCGVLYVR